MLRFLLIFLVAGLSQARIDDDPENTLQNVSEMPPEKNETAIKKLSNGRGIDAENECFYEPPEFCLREKLSNCDCNPHPDVEDTIICCNVTDLDRAIQCIPQEKTWRYIHIHNLTKTDLELNRTIFKTMNSVAVTNGKIKRIVGAFARMSQPKCLNFSNNNILEIENPRAFTTLALLKMLDLSHNNLTNMPKMINNAITLTIDIRGNSNISCKSIADIIVNSIQFVDINETYCKANTTYNWFNSTEKISIMNLKRMKQLQHDCPKITDESGKLRECVCTANRMHYVGNHLVFNAQVNCSGIGLTNLPETLPENTISLDVSNNQIESMPELRNNSYYKHLINLYADNNRIKSLLDLEGTEFFKNFMNLFLRRNEISAIPIYILNNALQKATNGEKIIYLGENRINCNCDSVKILSAFFSSYANHIPDHEKVFCKNLAYAIKDLQYESKLCQPPNENFIYYIYYVIAVEIFLLAALIIKVSYDYWVFKTTGFLPWPASSILFSRLEFNNPKNGFQKTP